MLVYILLVTLVSFGEEVSSSNSVSFEYKQEIEKFFTTPVSLRKKQKLNKLIANCRKGFKAYKSKQRKWYKEYRKKKLLQIRSNNNLTQSERQVAKAKVRSLKIEMEDGFKDANLEINAYFKTSQEKYKFEARELKLKKTYESEVVKKEAKKWLEEFKDIPKAKGYILSPIK